MSSQYIDSIKNFSTETEIKEYAYWIIDMINNLNYQLYLYSKTDLSYCRLYKFGIYMLVNNDLFEKYYLSIYEHKHLSKIEKSRLFEKLFYDISMMDFRNMSYEYNIEDFNQKLRIHKNKDIYPIEIKFEPIALMVLRMFENKDEENIRLFFRNRLENDLINAIKTLVLLSITEAIFRERKIYRMDLDIDIKFSIALLKKSNIFSMNIDISKWSEFYKIILEKYTSSDSNSVSGSYYGSCPKFKFSKYIVDTYFLFVAEKINQKDKFIERIGIPEIEKDNLVQKQLEEYINMEK